MSQRGTWFVRAFLEYIPTRVVVEAGARLDPRKSYIVSSHPHSMLMHTGPVSVFTAEEARAAFAGVDVVVATKPALFLLPGAREALLGLGG